MKFKMPEHVERGRITRGYWGTHRDSGFNGMFVVPPLKLVVSDGTGWLENLPPPVFEHVSVSRRDRCPNWDEMCQVKGWFWDPEELVIQYHPPRSAYVNQHKFCLHLWKPVGVEIPLPPHLAVGWKKESADGEDEGA